MTQHFQPDHKAALDALLLDLPGVGTGHMFGHPSYTIAGKVFVAILEDGIILKLPPEPLSEVLAHDNAELFAPGGMPMREWAYLHVQHAADYAGYRTRLHQALDYVLELATTPKRKR